MLGLIGAFYLNKLIMKKIVLVSALAMSLFSCQKENSWCGVVISKNDKDNSVKIKDNRTSTIKTIYVFQESWNVAAVGQELCTLNNN